MKKMILTIFFIGLTLFITGCSVTTKSTDESGNSKNTFNVNEIAIVNQTKIKINSIKRVNSECSLEYDGKCQIYDNPENDFFLVIDLTIENTGDKETSVSSILSFNLKDVNGEKGKYAYLSKSINSQLDGSIMAGDLLKGQIAYDVKESDVYNFYYSDSLLDNQIKFIINKSDIQ